MRKRVPVWLGGAALLLWFWPRHTDTPAHLPWPGPTGTRWAGTELRAMQQWGGYFSGVGLRGEYLELRCRRWPLLRTRQTYWPGAEWNGWARWSAERVTYQPTNPGVEPLGLPAPWWLRLCLDP